VSANENRPSYLKDSILNSKKVIPDYSNLPPPAKPLWKSFGDWSLGLTVLIPFSLIGFALFPFVVLAAFLTGVLAVTLSNGRSIKGWIGTIISSFFLAFIIWMWVS